VGSDDIKYQEKNGGKVSMPLYAVLGKFTNKRMKNIKDIKKGLAASKKAMEAVGAKMVAHIFTMGQYDVVAIIEAPTDEAIATSMLDFGRLGVLRTETLRGFTADEYVNMIENLP
jgi:uncharacterized protein with GYD domain